jgi:hypothetical protein
MISFSAPDLSKHPPRSPRVRLCGFVHLPRLLDKARAKAFGNLGEYVWNCPLDQRWAAFTGIHADQVLEQVQKGASDAQVAAWVLARMQPQRQPWEIAAWSQWMEGNGPGDAQRHQSFSEEIRKNAPERDDIRTGFDRLDMDDYVSFGGKA